MPSWRCNTFVPVVNMKLVFLACFFFLVAYHAVAQSAQSVNPVENKPGKEMCTLAGTVVRLDTGEPLKKARVYLLDHQKGEKSVFDGILDGY
jgi:hypothetical protein